MNPELEKFAQEAEQDPEGWAMAVLADAVKLTLLASFRADDRGAYEWLLGRLRAAKIENLGGLKVAVAATAKSLNGHEAPGPLSHEDFLAECRTRLNGQSHGLDLAAILEDVLALLLRYMRFSTIEQAWACCLWVVHTYCLPAANTSPRLHVKAPDPECGKTRLLELLVEVAFNGKLYIKPTSAVIYRLLNKQPYTFLLDEIDGVYGHDARGDEDLRMIIDAGQRRGGTVPRCVGDASNMDVVDFPVFAPMALAGIGRLPRTIESRSVPIALERKMANEAVASLYFEDIEDECADLRLRLGAWADAHLHELKGRHRRPRPLPQLGDRSNEGWFPLRAIANAAGGAWPERATQAAVLLSQRKLDKHGGINSADLLRDIRDIFEEQHPADGRLLTEFLLEQLNQMEEAPWALLNKGAGLNSHRLASVLREYRIESSPYKVSGKTRRGYEREQFVEAWDRYLSESGE